MKRKSLTLGTNKVVNYKLMTPLTRMQQIINNICSPLGRGLPLAEDSLLVRAQQSVLLGMSKSKPSRFGTSTAKCQSGNNGTDESSPDTTQPSNRAQQSKSPLALAQRSQRSDLILHVRSKVSCSSPRNRIVPYFGTKALNHSPQYNSSEFQGQYPKCSSFALYIQKLLKMLILEM